MPRPAVGVLLVAMLILSSCSGRSQESEAPVDRRIREVLGISMPCSLKRVEMHPDGGSLGGLLAGAEGESLLFAHDWRVRPMPAPPNYLKIGSSRFHAWAESVAQAQPRLVTIGADYPARVGAKPLPVGSEAESLFLVAVRSALTDETLPALSLSRAAGMLAFLEHQRNPSSMPTNPRDPIVK
jgi:hypothetical protein